jgi:hypothetical protein
MNVEEVAPYVGVAVCVVLLGVLATPYLLVTGLESQSTLAFYYGAGPVGGNAVGFFALLSVVVFLAGRRGRTNPDVAAGIALVLGVAAALLALLWAVSIDESVLLSFPSSASWIEFHPWAVVALSFAVPVVAGAYARSVLE